MENILNNSEYFLVLHANDGFSEIVGVKTGYKNFEDATKDKPKFPDNVTIEHVTTLPINLVT